MELVVGEERETGGDWLESGGLDGDHVGIDRGMCGEPVGSGEGSGCDACRGSDPGGVEEHVDEGTCRAPVLVSRRGCGL